MSQYHYTEYIVKPTENNVEQRIPLMVGRYHAMGDIASKAVSTRSYGKPQGTHHTKRNTRMKNNNLRISFLIPARNGSKRLPRKNIRILNGYPLVSHSINHALRSKYTGQIIVSSNDTIVEHIVQHYHNQRIVFDKRPEEYCGDKVSTDDVIRYIETKYDYDVLVLLEPTAPIRDSRDIDYCIDLLIHGNLDSVATVARRCEYVFIPNGNVFVMRRGKNSYNDNMVCVVLCDEKSIHIDTKFHFDIADLVMKSGFLKELK